MKWWFLFGNSFNIIYLIILSSNYTGGMIYEKILGGSYASRKRPKQKNSNIL